jgi:hypothetical protein
LGADTDERAPLNYRVLVRMALRTHVFATNIQLQRVF